MQEKTRSFIVLAVLIGATLAGVKLIQGHSATGQGQVLRELARPGDIVMLSSTTCIYCKRAREWFTEQRVPHRECFIEKDAACLAEYQARGGMGTPTLVVRGETQLGFSPERISRRLAGRG